MVEINNLTINLIDEDFLKKVARIVFKGEGGKEADLSVALISQQRMKKLNRRYRGKNRVTDVLAFPESKVLLEKFNVGPVKKIAGLGEIVICPSEVKKNATRFGQSPEGELATCLIHGILHLLGYDHEKNEKGAEKMKEKQKHYLGQLKLNLYDEE
jgi:rRNA maturation RNase YbeY